MSVDAERLRQRVEDLARDAGHGFRARDLRQEDAELVAADARDRVGGAQRSRAAGAAMSASSAIAERVSEAVVDELEVIDVEIHHRHAARGCAAPRRGC